MSKKNARIVVDSPSILIKDGNIYVEGDSCSVTIDTSVLNIEQGELSPTVDAQTIEITRAAIKEVDELLADMAKIMRIVDTGTMVGASLALAALGNRLQKFYDEAPGKEGTEFEEGGYEDYDGTLQSVLYSVAYGNLSAKSVLRGIIEVVLCAEALARQNATASELLDNLIVARHAPNKTENGLLGSLFGSGARSGSGSTFDERVAADTYIQNKKAKLQHDEQFVKRLLRTVMYGI